MLVGVHTDSVRIRLGFFTLIDAARSPPTVESIERRVTVRER